jgi:hypothetical protein
MSWKFATVLLAGGVLWLGGMLLIATHDAPAPSVLHESAPAPRPRSPQPPGALHLRSGIPGALRINP